MKKITLLFVFGLIIGATTIFGQATKQLNFGLIGVSYDIPVATNIAISPFAGTNFDVKWLNLGVKGNYYFDGLLKLPVEWDIYGGAAVGYAIAIDNDKKSDLDLGLQVGARWFWNDKWGVYLEFGGGGHTGGTGGLGLTVKL